MIHELDRIVVVVVCMVLRPYDTFELTAKSLRNKQFGVELIPEIKQKKQAI